jgi:hypothetical protein
MGEQESQATHDQQPYDPLLAGRAIAAEWMKAGLNTIGMRLPESTITFVAASITAALIDAGWRTPVALASYTWNDFNRDAEQAVVEIAAKVEALATVGGELSYEQVQAECRQIAVEAIATGRSLGGGIR